MSRYETVSELLAAVRKRGIQVSREDIERGVEGLGLREPFGSADLEDLVSHLGPKYTKNSRIIRVERILASKEWSDAVVAVRLESGLPSSGSSESNALELYLALLDTGLGNRPMAVKIADHESRPIGQFWREMVSGARRLCTLSEIDPITMDDMRVAYANRSIRVPLGLGKILDPKGVFMIDGKEMIYGPNQTDYLIGNVLWDHLLDPRVMEPKPSVSIEWILLNDGRGRFLPHLFNERAATAAN